MPSDARTQLRHPARCPAPFPLPQEALNAYCFYVQPCSKVVMGLQVPPEVRRFP